MPPLCHGVFPTAPSFWECCIYLPGSVSCEMATSECRCLAKDACQSRRHSGGCCGPGAGRTGANVTPATPGAGSGTGISTPQSSASLIVTPSLLECKIFWQSAFCKSKQLFHQHLAASEGDEPGRASGLGWCCLTGRGLAGSTHQHLPRRGTRAWGARAKAQPS